MDLYTPRRCCLILVVLTLSACNFNPGNANEPPGVQTKPSQVKVRVAQVIEDDDANVRGDAQIELDLTPPGESTGPTFAVQATGDGSKQVSIAAIDRGQTCWVTFSYSTIVQLNGSVDAQTLGLEFALTETYEGKPTTTSDCGVIPSVDRALCSSFLSL